MLNSEQVLKKSLRYRAHHRGTKEADKVVGGYVDHVINTLNPEQLQTLLSLVSLDDSSFFDLMQGGVEPSMIPTALDGLGVSQQHFEQLRTFFQQYKASF